MQGLTTSAQHVDFLRVQPMFREYIQTKYLNATTTRRCYYNLTGAEVERLAPKQLVAARAVKPLVGTNYYCLFIQ